MRESAPKEKSQVSLLLCDVPVAWKDHINRMKYPSKILFLPILIESYINLKKK